MCAYMCVCDKLVFGGSTEGYSRVTEWTNPLWLGLKGAPHVPINRAVTEREVDIHVDTLTPTHTDTHTQIQSNAQTGPCRATKRDRPFLA